VKIFRRGGLAFLFAAATANAQFEGVAEMRIATTDAKAATSGTGKIYLSKLGWRSEVEMPAPETEPAADRSPVKVVYVEKQNEPGTIFKINEAKKTYSVLHRTKARAAVKRKGGPRDESIVKKVGEDTVAGLPCKTVQITWSRSRTVTDACLSEEFVTSDWLRTLRRQSRPGVDLVAALKDAGLEGSPIRLQTKEADGSGLTVEVTKIERQQVPDSAFEVPAGYAREEVTPRVVPVSNREEPTEGAETLKDAERQIRDLVEKMTPAQEPNDAGEPE
jgi:hypothetical protein